MGLTLLTVSRVSLVLGILKQIASNLLHIIFGIAELVLTCVFDKVVDGQFPSWVIFVLFVFLFVGLRRGCDAC